MLAIRALLCVALCALLVRCSDEPEASSASSAPTIEIRGAVAAARTAAAAASIDGRLASVNAAEGAMVKQGDVVATLVSPAIDRDLAYARAQVASVEHRLRDARKPIATSLILGDAGARERASAEILKTREARRDRYRELFKTHDVTKQELEDAEAAYSAALRDWLVERERASMKVVETDTSVLKLELERARAEVAYVEDRKKLLEVKAPMSGVVTRVAGQVGENVYTRD